MSLRRAVLVAGAALALACCSDDTTSYELETPAAPTAVAGGEQYTVTLHGKDGDAANGQLVTFSTATMGVTISPAMTAFDEHGNATTAVIVPYGTALVLQGTTADGIVNVIELSAPAVSIALAIATDPAGSTPVGELLDVTATTTGGTGVALTFATTSTAVVFSPTSAVTDDSGHAATHVFVPFSTLPVAAVVTGGGAATTNNLIALTLDTPTVGTGVPTMVGSASETIYPVTAVVRDKVTQLGVQGVTVTFSVAAGATASPATVVTGSDGTAVSQVAVSTTTEVEVSAAGQVAPAVEVKP